MNLYNKWKNTTTETEAFITADDNEFKLVKIRPINYKEAGMYKSLYGIEYFSNGMNDNISDAYNNVSWLNNVWSIYDQKMGDGGYYDHPTNLKIEGGIPDDLYNDKEVLFNFENQAMGYYPTTMSEEVVNLNSPSYSPMW